MPEQVARLYNEANAISQISPRGVAALLRLAVQILCQELGERGHNINDDIASLVSKGLSPKVQKALDLVRVIGNNAVHPGQIDVDQPDIVETLFKLLNIIVETMITIPRGVEEAFDLLPQGQKDAINRRDGNRE